MTRLAMWSIRRPWVALGVWLAVVLGLGYNALTVEDQLRPPTIETDGAESQRADDAGAKTFGRNTSVPVMLEGPPGAVRRQGQALARALTADGEREVISPFDPQIPPDFRRVLRPDRRTAVIIAIAPTREAIDDEAGDAVKEIVDAEVRAPVEASVTGFSTIGGAFADESIKGVRFAEKIAIPILLIVLLFVFRSPIAASIPLVLGIGTTVAGLGILGFMGRTGDVADISISVCSLMSLALGVDYSLLMLSRFREEMRHRESVIDAAYEAVRTSGRTVEFAGLAILVVMVGLLFSAPGSNAVTAFAGPASGTIAALFSAFVATPALLRLLGPRVDHYRIGPPLSDDGGHWGQIARWAQRKPWLAIVPTVIGLAILAPSALGLDTGPPDPRTLPGDAEVRTDAERVARAVGPGVLSPLVIDVRSAERAGVPDAVFAARLRRDPGALAVLGPPAARRDTNLRRVTVRGNTSRFIVVPKTPPNEPETAAHYDRMKDFAAYYEARFPGTSVLVGGVAAQLTDAGRDIAAGFAPMVAVIVLLTALLLFIALRAIILPLVCVAINLVSVMAALGVMALLCTGDDPLLGGPGFADNTALLGAFSIIFALSIDYQVFILERIREEWQTRGDVESAVSHAIDQTARVITGAAAILIAVFAAFAIPELQTLRQTGIAMSIAILVDATLVRLVLLPAAITLIGPRCFWLPRWMDRLLPRLTH